MKNWLEGGTYCTGRQNPCMKEGVVLVFLEESIELASSPRILIKGSPVKNMDCLLQKGK